MEDKILKRIPLPIFDKPESTKTFRSAIHYKEQGKIGQQVESILIFSYLQTKIDRGHYEDRNLSYPDLEMI